VSTEIAFGFRVQLLVELLDPVNGLVEPELLSLTASCRIPEPLSLGGIIQ
jgi:hypothetical protein